jgi:hypothetical protein
VLEETFSSLGSEADRNLKVLGSHAELWRFAKMDTKTEVVCEELKEMVKSPRQRKRSALFWHPFRWPG